MTDFLAMASVSISITSLVISVTALLISRRALAMTRRPRENPYLPADYRRRLEAEMAKWETDQKTQ